VRSELRVCHVGDRRRDSRTAQLPRYGPATPITRSARRCAIGRRGRCRRGAPFPPIVCVSSASPRLARHSQSTSRACALNKSSRVHAGRTNERTYARTHARTHAQIPSTRRDQVSARRRVQKTRKRDRLNRFSTRRDAFSRRVSRELATARERERRETVHSCRRSARTRSFRVQSLVYSRARARRSRHTHTHTHVRAQIHTYHSLSRPRSPERPSTYIHACPPSILFLARGCSRCESARVRSGSFFSVLPLSRREKGEREREEFLPHSAEECEWRIARNPIAETWSLTSAARASERERERVFSFLCETEEHVDRRHE